MWSETGDMSVLVLDVASRPQCIDIGANVPHAKQVALRRAVGVLMESSVQMQSPSSLPQVSMWPKPVCVVSVGGVVCSECQSQAEKMVVSIESVEWMRGMVIEMGWEDRCSEVEMTMPASRAAAQSTTRWLRSNRVSPTGAASRHAPPRTATHRHLLPCATSWLISNAAHIDFQCPAPQAFSPTTLCIED